MNTQEYKDLEAVSEKITNQYIAERKAGQFEKAEQTMQALKAVSLRLVRMVEVY